MTCSNSHRFDSKGTKLGLEIGVLAHNPVLCCHPNPCIGVKKKKKRFVISDDFPSFSLKCTGTLLLVISDYFVRTTEVFRIAS